MPTRTKINEDSYKVKRNLDEIIDAAGRLRRNVDDLEPVILARRDHRLTKKLMDSHKDISEIERKARNARGGKYEE